jgi:hypothetical protein
MTFGERVVGAMKLDPKTFEDVERDTTAMGQAVGVIVLAAVAAGIGSGSLSGIVMGTIASLIAFLIWAVVVWAIGTKVMPDPETKADIQETFRVLGFAAAPGLVNILRIIPILGYLIWLAVMVWQIAAMVVAVKQVLDYSNIGKAIVVVIIGYIVCMVVFVLLLVPMMGARLLFG